MRQTDLSILTHCTMFHWVLMGVMLLYGTADFCDASDASCGFQIPSTTIVQSFGQKCYHFIGDEMYWTTARNYCTKYRARLVKNDDAETNNFLSTALNSITGWQNDGVWIGLHDRNKEFQWEWTTGMAGVDDPVSWTNWASGHPSSVLHTRRDCVRMKRSRGKWLWVDTPCETLRWHYRFICEYDFPEADNSKTAEASLDTTKLEGNVDESTDEDGSAGFYYSGIFLVALLTLAILTCCICNIYVLCQRRKAGSMGVMGIWPFSVIPLFSRRTGVARAEPNTYMTLEMLAIRTPSKAFSEVDMDLTPEENLYWPMDGSSQRHQQSVYLSMGNAINLPGCLDTTNENALMESSVLGQVTTQWSDLDVAQGTVIKRVNDDEVRGYATPQPKDIYSKPRTIIKRENGNETMGYDIPRPHPVNFETRTIGTTARDQSTYIVHKNSEQRDNTYETIECSGPKSVLVYSKPETQNKEMDNFASEERNRMKSESEEHNSNHLYSEIPEGYIQSGHIYEQLDDLQIPFSL